MLSQLVKFGGLVLSFALAMTFASSSAWPQTDAVMTQERSIADQTFSSPFDSGFVGKSGGDMKSTPSDRSLLPRVGLSPVLDAGLVEALQRQQATQERDILERAMQRDAVRLEEQRRQGPGGRGFFSDSQ